MRKKICGVNAENFTEIGFIKESDENGFVDSLYAK